MNDNCLINMACPKCENEGPFKIGCSALFLVSDDGTGEYNEIDWEPSSFCLCTECKHEATVADFTIPPDYYVTGSWSKQHANR